MKKRFLYLCFSLFLLTSCGNNTDTGTSSQPSAEAVPTVTAESTGTADDLKKAAEAFSEPDPAAEITKYLSGGHCWIACGEDYAVILQFDDQSLHFDFYNKDGDNISINRNASEWSIDASILHIQNVDANASSDYRWSFENQEEQNLLTLSNEEQTLEFYELSVDDADIGQEYASSYLQSQKDISEIEDLTSVLAGYEGVSIVDAFVLNGLNPSLENRAVYAEHFGIENYRGTAKQNLTLLTEMGGVIK